MDDPTSAFGRQVLNRELVHTLRSQPGAARSDAETAAALCRLVHNEFESYGTDGNQRLNDDEIRLTIRSLKSTMQRLGLELHLPFSDYGSFRTHWIANDGHGSWQTRRDILNELFSPHHESLARLEDGEIVSSLAKPASSHPGTGWQRVDAEVNELRRHFQAARTPQDYRNVGNDCVAVTERLSEEVYDPDRHLRSGEEVPPVAKTKQRIERFVEDAAPGPQNAPVRRVAKAVIELAQAVKHQTSPSRRDAGIAADSVIQLANILRRLSDDLPDSPGRSDVGG